MITKDKGFGSCKEIFPQIHEELFHIFQKQEESKNSSEPKWKTGDYELEAKCYTAKIFFDAYPDVSFGNSKSQEKIMIDYMDNPSDENFEKARKELERRGYDSGNFPISPNIPDRTKHIK